MILSELFDAYMTLLKIDNNLIQTGDGDALIKGVSAEEVSDMVDFMLDLFGNRPVHIELKEGEENVM